MRVRDRKLYATWCSMNQRCTNPNHPKYSRYGGRGITICDRWKVFSTFEQDMGVRPEGCTLDRIDNDGSYSPDNCRWANKYTQISNTSRNLTGYVVNTQKYRPSTTLSKPWKAEITIQGKRIVKYFSTQQEASLHLEQLKYS